MKNLSFLILLVFFACSQKENNEKSDGQSKKVVKKDSIITLEIRAKPGDQFYFGYTDSLYNFNIIETPEKLTVDSIFKKTIVSNRPMLLRDIHWKALNYIYLIPGETYRITQDSMISSFEIAGNAKRTYELNAMKELKKRIREQHRITEFDINDVARYQKFAKMDFKSRDSVLKVYYEDNIQFLNSYASKNNFSNDQKNTLAKNLLYQYKIAHLNLDKRTPGPVKKYLSENKSLYNELLPMMSCDSCFNDPDFPYLTQVFAKHYVADPDEVGSENAYSAYRTYFKGKARDYLLYNLIKLGGMFNETKPNPMLAKQFQNDAQNPILKDYIREMYDFRELKKSATGRLANSDGEDISWTKLLEKHKGKVIYVDFWASWCGPCRAETPSAKLLKKRFEAKDVVFVNISMDENSVAWKKASQLDGIESPENYILIQPDKSKLKKQYKINLIPRYFLINRSGKIVNSNASHPSDDDSASEIERLL